MSEVFKGFVKTISVKEGHGRRGPWKLFSAKLEREDGTEVEDWITFGFDKPTCREGDYVKITASKNDRGYFQADEVKRLKNAPARSSATAGTAAGANVSNNTQKSIHYQSSRNAAIQAITLLLANDALPMSSAKTKAGEAKRFEEITALIDKLTVRYFFDAETQRLLTTVADDGAVTNNAGELPDADDSEKEADDEEGDDELDDEDDE